MTERTCPPCDGLCQQGRDCPMAIVVAELPPEDQSEGVPGREYLRPGLLVLLVVCVLGAIASCVLNGMVRP